MNKRLLWFSAGLVVAGLAVWGYVRWYTERNERSAAPTEKEMAKLISRRYGQLPTEPSVMPMAPLDPSHPVRLAIGGFGFSDDTRNRELADLVTVHLSGAKGLDLVDRQSLDKALRESEMSLSGLVRASDAIRVGKLLKADWFLLGSTSEVTNRATLIVARIVDARTGVMRDVAVFGTGTSLTDLATQLGAFVRKCRTADPRAKPHSYLAIGSFGDVGVNSRQSTFPTKLDAFLTTAYHGSRLTLLERDYVSAMLQEVRLDLAGLTEESTNPPPPLQSAFWVIDGFFQSFETTNQEVEVVLRVTRAFGRTTTAALRGDPDSVFRKVKATIDRVLAQAEPNIVAPTRRGELRQQIETGKELFNQATGGVDPMFMAPPGYSIAGNRSQEPAKRRRNLEEAVRAFETALLLEHENHEAKFYLAACYRDSAMYRIDEARGFLREVAASPPEDRWCDSARVVLARTYQEAGDFRAAAKVFEEAARTCSDPARAEFYRAQAQENRGRAIASEASANGGVPSDAESKALLEQRLLGAIKMQENVLKGQGGGIDDSGGLAGFVETFGSDRQAAARGLVELLPKLREQFPQFMPHLVAAALTYQVDTNTPVLAAFRDSLVACRQQPQSVLGCSHYFGMLMRGPYNWVIEHRLFPLALEVVQAKRDAAKIESSVVFDERDQVRLAFAYVKLERWADALHLFEELGDRPIVMAEDGPWGAGGVVPFLPGRAAAHCREKLGLSSLGNSERFALGKACVRVDAFAIAGEGLWIAVPGKLLQLDFDFKTNLQLSLPATAQIPAQGLCVSPDKIWVATSGSGLLEVDKSSGKGRTLTERDGLLLNQMTAIILDGHSLWLGFGQGSVGGLGRFDLDSGRLSAFTPALNPDPGRAASWDPQDGPPRHPTYQLACAGNQVWMSVDGKALRGYSPSHDIWAGLPELNDGRLDCFACDRDRLVVGFGRPQSVLVLANDTNSANSTNTETTRLAVDPDELARARNDPKLFRRIKQIQNVLVQTFGVRTFRDGAWRTVTGEVGLPDRPTLLALHSSDVFLGGQGYIAIFDLERQKVRKLCYLPTVSIDRFDFGGGYLWVQVRGYLYRVPLSELR